MRKFVIIGMLMLFVIPSLTSAQQNQRPRLPGGQYNPEKEADIDMYLRNWTESMPIKTHSSLIERDILTKGDPLNPARRGTVLKYVNRFTRASLGANETTPPVTLQNEQEIFYILSGKGTITAGDKTAELYSGIAVLMPANLEFSMKNTSDELLTMLLLSEPYPEGFRLNTEMLVVDENTQPMNTGYGHWSGLSKSLFKTQDGLGTLESIITVQLDAMTFFHPHTHADGTEEVWTSITDDIHVLLGKQVRAQPPGTAYMIPPDNMTWHANFNVSQNRVKLFYFARYREHEVRE